MGANKRAITKKCGEILISLKTNKKSRVYIFSCALCEENCDQLKKFSLHLEEKHSKFYDNDTDLVAEVTPDEKHENKQDIILEPNETPAKIEDIKENLEIFVPEIKVEELMDIANEEDEDDFKQTNNASLTKNEYESADPLETTDKTTTRFQGNSIRRSSTGTDLKNVKGEHESDDDTEDADNNYEFSCEFDYEDSVGDSGGSESDQSEKKADKAKNKLRKRKSLRVSRLIWNFSLLM